MGHAPCPRASGERSDRLTSALNTIVSRVMSFWFLDACDDTYTYSLVVILFINVIHSMQTSFLFAVAVLYQIPLTAFHSHYGHCFLYPVEDSPYTSVPPVLARCYEVLSALASTFGSFLGRSTLGIMLSGTCTPLPCFTASPCLLLYKQPSIHVSEHSDYPNIF